MLPVLKRHEIALLLRAGHPQKEVAEFVGVGERTVRRVAREGAVSTVTEAAEVLRARLGRPSKVQAYRSFVTELVGSEPDLLSVEILRRARLAGYSGGKSALYDLITSIRPSGVRATMRFEGLPGEFSQHDFGEVDVNYLDGRVERIHFFGSRLKWSRWVEVTLVSDQTVETLVRTLLDHFVSFGGVPLCAVFDRPKTVALKWKRNGEVTEWNPTFAYAALEMGFTAEVCWPYQPQQKGSVENLVKWVKGSFFKQRRFVDRADLEAQLAEWLREVNRERPSRATGVIPAERLAEDRARLRALRIAPEDLALRFPVSVGPTAVVIHDTHSYSMAPEAAGFPATLYLYRDRVRIVAGRFEAVHPRQFAPHAVSRLPEHRALHLAAISGKRGKRYLKRQHLFETGEAAVLFLTEIVHRRPRAWARDVDELHEILQAVGPEAMERASRTAVELGHFEAEFIAQVLGRPSTPMLPFSAPEVN